VPEEDDETKWVTNEYIAPQALAQSYQNKCPAGKSNTIFFDDKYATDSSLLGLMPTLNQIYTQNGVDKVMKSRINFD
jgi:hypothetical protein